MKIYDMLIVGGGPGGYTAALYAARAGLQVAVVEKLSAGGQMALTDKIDNYPGFPDGVEGFQLAEDMERQALKFGAESILAEVTEVELEGPIKKLHTTDGLLQARTVAIATGADPKHLGIPGEESYSGRGVHYCASCDGFRYKGKVAMVVGGGNSAVEDALILSRVAEKVILVHRRDTLRAEKIGFEALKSAGNVEFLWNSSPVRLNGEKRLESVVIRDVVSGEEREIPSDGFFVSIGRKPATALLEGKLPLDQGGYIPAGENTETEIPGVYAVGDVRTKPLRQIVTAISDGAMAAFQAQEYLAKQ